LFLTEDFSRIDQLPLHFDELVVAGRQFHLKPLLPLFSGDGRFYVLALSQNEVRLLQGTSNSLDEIDYEGLPASMADALREEDPERQVQFHTATGAPGTARERAAIFYGQNPTQEKKETLLRYFQEVDEGLHPLLRNESAPLLLASVEYLFPIYEEANTYPHLLDRGITGNPEALSPEELHARAWQIAVPYFMQAQQEATRRYYELAGRGQASGAVEEVVPAAYYGRVDTLFVATDRQRWGTFNGETGRVRLEPGPTFDNDDLLSLTAVQTLLNGGTVYAVKAETVPGDDELAALFRYELAS
ncbi:MAG: hypothetical protein L0346_11705, partial [Chloroflexi bacterium]|nr:hypothetical protein [Chloroflexota bacterium]